VVQLEASKLFSQLPASDLEALRKIASERRFETSAEIFKEGDLGDGLYVIKDGLVEISGLLNSQVRHVFSRLGPGEIFGEMAVLDQKPRSACATAAQPTLVYFIGCDDMQALVERSPKLAMALLREISNRLREFNRQYVREVIQGERLAIVGRFARSIVHDLKNPLNIIGITAEMADMPQATAEHRRQAKVRIRKQVERISDLINEILEFTQGSHNDFVAAPIDYGAFVRQLAEEMRPEVGLKSMELELDAPAEPIQLLIDPKRLRRVFENLIHNATDAMSAGGKVTVHILPGKEEVVTEIEDAGPGIAPEMAGHLFETFATFGKAHGTGLGLSICKRIIEDHHGWISARNKDGQGAIFSFGLPRPRVNL
jgi:signal transduction histidine kinase